MTGRRIEDYALLGDTRTAALVSRDGSIDWLCVPRFDAGACFASLLGDAENGRWLLTPVSEVISRRRRYRSGTLILETDITTRDGRVRITEAMLPESPTSCVVRVIEGIEGRVRMRTELVVRFDYGRTVPWVRKVDGALVAIGGPDALALHSPVVTHGEGLTTIAELDVVPGDRIPLTLTWYPSHDLPPPAPDALAALDAAERWWSRWAAQCQYDGPYREAVLTSLVTLKALTFAPTGGIVAAPTTSLPEHIGGVRNWDYRYCWLRDATFTLYALMLTGFRHEACAWRDWLLRAVAGAPSQLQIMYGVGGERRLPELELRWLRGYESSVPVRIGNAAVEQLQLDVYGEVIDALFHARRAGLDPDPFSWHVEQRLLAFLESGWKEVDAGLWEVRGPLQHFTHSKVMAWVAFDRAVKSMVRMGREGPVERWRAIRDSIHDEVIAKAFDPGRNAFMQAYGSHTFDASALLLPLVGFLPVHDARMLGTVRAIEKNLLVDGLVLRYRSDETRDGLPPGEGTFLACSFWLADNYALMGRVDEARALYERLLAVRNDVGLLAEQYDPATGRQLGNFPQAFSHVGVVNTAYNLRPRAPNAAVSRGDGQGAANGADRVPTRRVST